MKNSKLVLFESSQAFFRLSVDTMYEKLKADGTTQSSVYINTQKESGTFRPSVFLVFTYLTDDFNTTKGIYTSVPHIYRIREQFEVMRNMLTSPDAFTTVDGNITVSPAYAEPVVIDNLSQKNNDWISLMLTVCKDTNSLVARPAVAIQHSKSGGFSSLLTADEFLTIYDLIMHIDYASLENQAVILELLSRIVAKGGSAGNVNSFLQQHNSTPVTPATSYGRTVSRAPVAPAYQRPQQASVSAPVSQGAKLPPRPAQVTPAPAPVQQNSSTPKINMNAIKDIPVEEDDMSLDDSDAVDAIFSEMNDD